MSKMGFAPAGSINRGRLMVAALMAMGALAVGLLGPALASADVSNRSLAVRAAGPCQSRGGSMPVWAANDTVCDL